MLNIGDRPDDFTLEDEAGAPVAWSALRGRPVVIFCYPKADTPGCTQEACAVRDLAADFEAAGVSVFGLSADAPKKQARFREKYGLSMRLLCDPEQRVLTAWGVWQEKKNYGKTYMGIVRSTFFFDASGRLVDRWSPVKVAGHAQAVLARVTAG